MSTAPDFLQAVMQAVWRWVAQDDEPAVTLGPLFDKSVFLECDTGGFVFERKGEGVYEVHTLFLPCVADALGHGKQAAEYMFTQTDCVRIDTQVPADNIPAKRLTEKMGATLIRTEPAAFLRGGVRHDVHHYALGKDAWLRDKES